MNEQDKSMYSFELNHHPYDQDNVYANLPSTHRVIAQNNNNNHNFVNQNGHSYNHLRNNNRQQSEKFHVHHYEPKGPTPEQQSPLNNMHLPSVPTEDELVTIFTELAESVNVILTEDLTRLFDNIVLFFMRIFILINKTSFILPDIS